MVASLGRAWWCFLVCFPLLVGCDGCRLTKQPADEAKPSEEQQRPFTSGQADVYPASRPDMRPSGLLHGSVKPGHWTTARLSIRSNLEDRRGVVQTRADVGEASSVIDAAVKEPANQAATSRSENSFLVRRPAVLPKGQMRRLETRFLAPHLGRQMFDNVVMDGQFLGRDSNARFDLRPARFATMLPQTYFLVILTNRPERFTRWQTADWVRPVQGGRSFERPPDNYRIIIPPTDGVLPIAETALDWTSTAVLLWDDVPLSALTPGQRTAILDWLNFGGLIVVNGTAGVDSLTEARFRDLLPIAPSGATELLSEDAENFLRWHSVDSDASTAAVIASLQNNSSHVAAAGVQRADAVEIGRGELLIERRVGRGRIVQCRVDLVSPWMMPWKSYDSFINSAVLARPPRVFHFDNTAATLGQPITTPATSGQPSEPPDEQVEIEVGLVPPVRQNLVGIDGRSASPDINTSLRWFSRDARMRASQDNASQDDASLDEAAMDETAAATATPADDLDAAWHREDVWSHPISGLGGWTNDSDLLTWCRSQLREEIGVSIPDSSLVFRSLMMYLFALIPLNYIVFRLLGHLEWAWLAVVPLSIAGAFWVAHAAQLDVGFARSRNELAMLELPADYSRGHLTRVVGLYNSLASRYRVDFDTPDAAIDVIRSRGQDQDPGQVSLFGSVDPEFELGFDPGSSMDNIGVGSNSYGVMHVEQMIDVGGSIDVQYSAPETDPRSLDGATIVNESSLELLDAFVIERDADGATRVAAMGTIGSSARKPIRMQAADRMTVPSDLPMGMSDAMDRLIVPESVPRGSARLVARLDRPLGGMAISPDCKQVRAQTIVLVHLAHPERPPPVSDENLIGDVLP